MLVLIGGAVAVVLLLATIASMFSYGRLIAASADNLRLERRLRLMEVELEKVQSLERELASSEKLRSQVLLLLGAAGVDTLEGAPAASWALASLDQDELRMREQDFLRSLPTTWPARGPVTRSFRTAMEGAAKYHPGLDIAAATGTPVRAAAEGSIVFAGSDPEYGKLVVIDHGLGFETRYAHNDRLSVRTGDPVTRGQLIASVGNTGHSTAPHLHFEIRKDGVPVDPLHYLD